MAKTDTRIYLVQTLVAGERSKRLIRAANSTQAWRYAAENTITCDLASQDELVSLVGEGVKVEDAKTTAEPATST